MNTVLSNLKVIELASVLAGPAVGLFFAEQGANVLKIENKKLGGDVTRNWKLPSEKKEDQSAYFSSVNWHKNYLALDLKEVADYNILMEHLKSADILITNFKAGDSEKLKLSHRKIKSINSDIIIAEIQGFGESDERVAYDLILQAETGFMSMNGNEESGPIKMPIALIDVLAAHQLKEGILMALLDPDKKGKVISVSLYDTAIASLANQASNYLMANHIPQRIGSTHPNIAPYGEIFTTKNDFLITFAIGSDRQFENLCLELGLICDKNLFGDNQLRVKNRKELEKIIRLKVQERQSEDLIKNLIDLKVPVAQIKDLKMVFEEEKSQELILEEKIGEQITKRVKSTAFKIKPL